MIDCWLAAADMKRRLGRLKEAEAEIDKCIAAAARHPTKLGYALYQKGYIFFLRNDFDVAEKLFRESASSEEKCPRAGWEVTSRISAAQAEVARLRRLTANDQYSRQVAHWLTVVSSTHPEDLADLEASLMQHLDFFRTRTESHAKRWVSNCVVHLADVRFEMGHSEKAKKDLTNHQESDEGKKHISIRPKVLWMQGRILLAEEKPELAEERVLRAESAYRLLGRREEFAGVLLALGDLRLAQGNKPAAKAVYQKVANGTDACDIQMCNERAVLAARERLKILSE